MPDRKDRMKVEAYDIFALIEELERRGDARVAFWKDVESLIAMGDHLNALRRLMSHKDDHDFHTQCLMVASAMLMHANLS